MMAETSSPQSWVTFETSLLLTFPILSQYCLSFLLMATGRWDAGVTQELPLVGAQGWVKLLWDFSQGILRWEGK